MKCKHYLSVALLLMSNSFFGGFTGLTTVKMPSSHVHIGKLKKGTYVESLDNNTHASNRVLRIQSKIEKACLCIVIHGERIITSKGQLFFCPVEHMWKRAQDLKPQDVLFARDGSHVSITAIDTINQQQHLFDITVDKAHNFYVSHSDVLVHNMSIPVGSFVHIAGRCGEAATRVNPVAVGAAIGGTATFIWKSSRKILGGIRRLVASGDALGRDKDKKAEEKDAHETRRQCTFGKTPEYMSPKPLNYTDDKELIDDARRVFPTPIPITDHQLPDAPATDSGLVKYDSGPVESGSSSVKSGDAPDPNEDEKTEEENTHETKTPLEISNNPKHTFKSNHGVSDTPENRQLAKDVASDVRNQLNGGEPDNFGNRWYVKVLQNGKQFWVKLEKGYRIKAVGINNEPRTFHPKTGLCNSTKPG